MLGEDTEWKETFDQLAETAPAQTWEPMLSALCTAELETATEDTAELHQQEMSKLKTEEECHHTDSRVLHAHVETEELLNEKNNHYGNDARVFNLTQQVVNRWTTLPLPTQETWIRATDQDPDLPMLTRAIKENTTPPKAEFRCKKYHAELAGHRMLLEDGTLYQLEQPKATRIRQLMPN